MYGLEELKFLEILFVEIIVNKVELVDIFVLLDCFYVMVNWGGDFGGSLLKWYFKRW